MMKFLAFAAALVFVTEAALVRRDACEDFIETCVAPLERYNSLFSDFGAGASHLSETDLNIFCTAMHQVTLCVANGGHACASDELDSSVSGMTAAVTYLCSPSGRTTLRAMARSECATDDMLMFRVNYNIQSCYNTFEQEINMFVMRAMGQQITDPLAHICPLLEQFRVCSVQGTSSVCGEAFGTFVNAVWDILMSQQMDSGLNCEGRAKRAHSMVTRALSFIQRRK